MNYVISYWVPPDMSEQRRAQLKAYFDLQRFAKSRFGAEQLIVTNLDYPGAIPFVEPPGFRREYGLFAMYFGLKQLIEQGLDFPITVHDHDLFIRAPMPEHATAIQCVGSEGKGTFSEQIVVFPACSQNALMDYIDYLAEFTFFKHKRNDYGTDVRHDNMYSSESAMSNLHPPPFANFNILSNIRHCDLVSFDIQGHHSLDPAYCESEPIAADTQAVHGHLNKGPASDALLEWLMA